MKNFLKQKKKENYEFAFTINGKRIKAKTKTMKELNINYNDIIMIN